MYSHLYANTPRGHITPVVLSDKITNAGAGKKICLVSDSRARVAPTSHQMANWLAQDGWQVTLLDLTPFDGMTGVPRGTKAHLSSVDPWHYTYVHLAGLFKENNHDAPTLSLCCYHWLRDHFFDLILFQHDFGAGYYACVARALGLAFQKTPIGVIADDPRAHWLENAKCFPEDLLADAELHYFEQQTVARADVILLTDRRVADWMVQTGWITSNDQGRLAVIGEDRGVPWGKWLASLLGRMLPMPLTESDISLSVCITVYNRADMLHETLKAMLHQTRQNFEVIVIDDGSIHPEVEALRRELAELFSKRKWLWLRQENQGPGAARNYAARHASGSHVFFFDDDNFPLPDMVELLMRAACSGADIITNSHGLHPLSQNAHYALAQFPSRASCAAIKNVHLHAIFYGASLLMTSVSNVIGDTHSLYRRDVFQKLGGFKSNKEEYFEDHELLLSAVIQGYRLEPMPEILLLYRFHQEGRCHDKEGIFRCMLQILRQYVPLMPEALHPLLFAYTQAGVNHHQRKPGRFPDNIMNTSYAVGTRHRRFRVTQPREPNIALGVTDKYLVSVGVVLASLLNSTSCRPNIYIISDMTPENNNRLLSIAAHFDASVTIVKMPAHIHEAMPVSFKLGREPNSLYWQLLLPELLPNVDRVLTIDHDRLVRHDITPLWQIDLGEHLLAAAPYRFLMDNKDVQADFGGDYFGSGVMLLNLKLWRQENIAARTFKEISVFEAIHDAHQFWEQSALNRVVAGRWTVLPALWDCMDDDIQLTLAAERYREDQKSLVTTINDPAIVFFSYAKRPWVSAYGAHSPLAHEYRVYQKLVERLLEPVLLTG